MGLQWPKVVAKFAFGGCELCVLWMVELEIPFVDSIYYDLLLPKWYRYGETLQVVSSSIDNVGKCGYQLSNPGGI